MAGRVRISLEDRFWGYAQIGLGCWLWRAALDRDGYGKFKIKKDGRWTSAYAHRVAFELHHGRQIRDGMEIHHACENRSCVRVDHLIEVDVSNHRASHAKSVCRKGHELVGDNVYEWNGQRYCEECRRIYRRKQ